MGKTIRSRQPPGCAENLNILKLEVYRNLRLMLSEMPNLLKLTNDKTNVIECSDTSVASQVVNLTCKIGEVKSEIVILRSEIGDLKSMLIKNYVVAL